MKTLIIFIPEKFYMKQPGYIYGNVVHDNDKDISKFYVLGLTKLNKSNTESSNTLVTLGYFYGTEIKNEYCDKKLPNWIELYVLSYYNLNYEYGICNIMIQNQKILPFGCHTVIILYDKCSILRAELYIDKSLQDNFSELRTILNKESIQRNHDKLQIDWFARIKNSIFIIVVLTFLYPTTWIYRITSKISPILKYSSLGLHIMSWLKTAQWTLSTLLEGKRFTLKIINYIIAVIIDILLGLLLLKLLLNFLSDSSPSEVLLFYAEKVVESLKELVNWLMGSPAGLKLNHSFNNILGKFFLYHIHLWSSFLIVSKPLMELAFEVLLFIGRLGITFQISIIADLFALISFHTYCIYIYAARLFNIQISGLIALFRLFLGKKKNPLRKRVDSCRYQPDQLFVGTLLFTILLFLMPTTWVYYIVFTTLRLTMIGLDGFLTRLKFYMQIIPIYGFLRWLFCTADATGSIGIKLMNRQAKGPIMLKTKTIIAPWSETWKKSIPDTINIHPPIEWSKIASNIFWGQLLYPF
ncbi:PREDICTED: phosphatidylinositol N-acetylglucosaminyltransferase subunit Q [Ceratosolen solmsi marchali]|uniref:Phosphatidylinositol N-acetylglucosaminyltransferase subunit Q n=1 Tax=Ceratosolen solmsi marchali TaxID=326594 RepID=A0AAJ6YFS2_9HYME|nr:PREDICTED: phosphatidylinositol N-acetylglucosaminyltransferase subunit Q [Ceratosolen solmsi marchali]